ncbi:uncharacterized protein NECHADRAFT_83551 [Fusarium vanettenii 77-13-4]|uniref:Heterokaryon incompatibility domain-containing protein n=1 Tax=Fusarium vanettenii (strain ATCC MYA-4622 / CBS 123669 / FGSC 9596 / NRRL 45880 / 77-13-4) TaxID=660122 RepID=C7Z4C1_FUSV7|nr:uncharacterized protein NECHADRAFT_83551 [Fusarium vanettenii 77-13-4]EEU41451.1 hypothetical protein NECHADRAFT_83551 [Fusarium vanettenii 77-13-4]
MTQAEGTESAQRSVSVKKGLGYNDWLFTNQSLYANAKETGQPSRIMFTIAQGIFCELPSSEVHTSEIPAAKMVYETLLVQVGELPPMELNLIISRGDNIYFDDCDVFNRQHSRCRVGRYRIDPDLGSPVNLSIAKGWLDDCRENHDECRPIKSSSLLTRVLDVTVSEGSHTCRLVETSNQQGNYVALSHCWGDKIKERLTTETLSTFLCSIQIAKLPANSETPSIKEDWASESEKMGLIYQHSTLTIFAMTSKGSEEGFLKRADSPYPNPTTLKVSSATDSQTSVLVAGRDATEENFTTLRSSSALSKRGWAFQEVILSNRSLFFGDRQLYWQCRKELDSLEGLYPFPSRYDADIGVTVPQTDGQPERIDDGSAKLDFYTLASKYNSRALTYSSDKLPAFSGLAQKFQHVFGGEYLAGLWSSDFPRGLLWYPDEISPSAAQPNGLPSWSWASTNKSVLFVTSQPQVFLKLHCSDVRPRNIQNRYGEIKSESDATRTSATVVGMTMPLARGNRVPDPHDQKPTILCHVSFDVLEKLEGQGFNYGRLGIRMAIIDGSFMLSPLYLEEEEGKRERKDALDVYTRLRCNCLALAGLLLS